VGREIFAALLVALLIAATAPSVMSRPGTASDRRGPLSRAAQRPLDLNRASAVELAALPGIGPTLARRIVDDRIARGPFSSMTELLRVRGIGPGVIRRLAPHAAVEVRE